jgi:hypothetical protein
MARSTRTLGFHSHHLAGLKENMDDSEQQGRLMVPIDEESVSS